MGVEWEGGKGGLEQHRIVSVCVIIGDMETGFEDCWFIPDLPTYI